MPQLIETINGHVGSDRSLPLEPFLPASGLVLKDARVYADGVAVSAQGTVSVASLGIVNAQAEAAFHEAGTAIELSLTIPLPQTWKAIDSFPGVAGTLLELLPLTDAALILDSTLPSTSLRLKARMSEVGLPVSLEGAIPIDSVVELEGLVDLSGALPAFDLHGPIGETIDLGFLRLFFEYRFRCGLTEPAAAGDQPSLFCRTSFAGVVEYLDHGTPVRLPAAILLSTTPDDRVALTVQLENFSVDSIAKLQPLLNGVNLAPLIPEACPWPMRCG